jgi:tetratricopeptide (TPR) repeat protein
MKPRQGLLTEGDKGKDRRNDTMYLEMQLGECYLLRGRTTEAEEIMQELHQRFRGFNALYHLEKFRVVFILAALARLRHLNNQFDSALEYWKQTLERRVTELNSGMQNGEWARNTFFPSIVLLSMADCHFKMGNLEKGIEFRREADAGLGKSGPRPWVLDLGTYWLAYVRKQLPPY